MTDNNLKKRNMAMLIFLMTMIAFLYGVGFIRIQGA